MADALRGWKFPPSFDPFGGNVELSDGMQSIKESLFLLLNTIPGERCMALRYGCDIDSLAFQNLNQNTKTFMANNIKAAVTLWERRVRVENVELTQESEMMGTIHIKITYTVLATGQKDEFLYDYSVK